MVMERFVILLIMGDFCYGLYGYEYHGIEYSKDNRILLKILEYGNDDRI